MISEYPEERLAKRVVERFKLTPPIDIQHLASLYADVQIVEFPVKVDGVSIGLKRPGHKPKVFLNASLNPRRARFTLAHELGHVLIPWHTGSIVDELDLDEGHEESNYWVMEGEANRFAAELLMPAEWVTAELKNTNDIASDIERLAKEAQVSVDAFVLRVLKYGPSGFVMARSDGLRVLRSSKTPGTLSNRLVEGSRARKSSIATAIYYGTHSVYDGHVHWWKEGVVAQLPDVPQEPWRDILGAIVNDIQSKNPEKLKQSINGIVAFANGSVREPKTAEKIYAACLLKTDNRNDLNTEIAKAIKHPRFKDFLAAKAIALMK